MSTFGIDISRWQGNFNVAMAKAEGVEFVIAKIGQRGSGIDKQFDANYKKCKELGIPVGCYFYGTATSVFEAQYDVIYWETIMSGYEFDLPVFYDVEGSMITSHRRKLTDIVKTVLSDLKSKGYEVGIYASESVFNNYLYDNELSEYYHWVAKWSKKEPTLSSGLMVDLWQFGGETNLIRDNKIAGVTCDQDYCYIDITKKEPVVALKTNEEIADEVIRGEWGNGDERKQRLTGAGYDYNVVQQIVNEKLNVNVKTYDDIALEVVRGEWGNGAERKQRLTEAGYDYGLVQQLVNKLMK